MLNTIKKDEDTITEIMINLQNRIRLIKEELINIKHAIQWAKQNIINSILLSIDEVKFSINKLKEEQMPFKTAEEALKFSKINVLSKDMTILYMIIIPLTFYETFKKIIIRPVKKEINYVMKTDYKEILKGKNKIYGIKNECENFNEIAIYKEINLIDLSKDDCISRIVNNLNSTCTITNGNHVPTIEETKTGIILLNKLNGKIEADGETKEINGTHVIIFYNSTIKINNQIFSKFEAKTIEAIPAIFQPAPTEKERIELLSLGALKELHLTNIKRINSLKKATLSIGSLISVALTTTIIIFILLRKKKIEIQYIEKEIIRPNMSQIDTLPEETHNIPNYIKFNDLPFY
ncbi:uncharacterized protein LOC125775416 [Bactrocera dorsalis]|uniref:Uncharacterized protein LOC125775416 n=1 Tax=Bactrocera dorsalis TaxID=27457 RepID=A0ABM3IYA2_BACDO|nr:uncharacterized protein LOC125775416 [Bactrocera dorsalis]